MERDFSISSIIPSVSAVLSITPILEKLTILWITISASDSFIEELYSLDSEIPKIDWISFSIISKPSSIDSTLVWKSIVSPAVLVTIKSSISNSYLIDNSPVEKLIDNWWSSLFSHS